MDTGLNQAEKYKRQAKKGVEDVAKDLAVGLKGKDYSSYMKGMELEETEEEDMEEVTGASSSGAYVGLFGAGKQKTNTKKMKTRKNTTLEDVAKDYLQEYVNLNEHGADTSWADDGDKVTLQDILELTKDIPIINYPTKELAPKVLGWKDNPEEIERISQVEVSRQYPILIMVNEYNEVQWVLDGNHRAQQALMNDIPTIPAKLIKPSDLDERSINIFYPDGIPDTENLNKLSESDETEINSEEELDEITGASSSGSFEGPAIWAKNKKNWRAVSDPKFPKYGGPGSTFVKVKKKCSKFPYCNQGDINALEFYEQKTLKEAIKSVSTKTGKPLNYLKNIILKEMEDSATAKQLRKQAKARVKKYSKKEIDEMIRRGFYKSPITSLVGNTKMNMPIGKLYTMKGNKPKYEA